MKKLSTIILLVSLTFWSGCMLYGQTKVDSLNAIIETAPNARSSIETYLNISREWLILNHDSAEVFIKKSLSLSERFEEEEYYIEALNQYGNLQQRRYQQDEALQTYARAIERAEKIDYKPGLAKLYNNVALIYTEKGDFPEALEEFTKATQIEEDLDNQEGIAQGLNNIGVVFYYQGDYDKSLEYFVESVKVHEAMGNMLSAKQGYNNIGAINEALQQYDSALVYYKRAMKISEDLGDRAEMGIAYNNVAGAYSGLKQWQESEKFYRLAMATNRENGDNHSLALNYMNLASLYIAAGKSSSAEAFFLEAEKLIADYDFKNLAYDLYGKIADYYALSERYAKAYAYSQKYQSLKDSIFNESKAKAIAETEALYETEKKERELAENKAALAQQDLKVQEQRWYLALLSAGVFILIFITVIIYRQQQLKRKQLEKEALLKEELAKAELKQNMEAQRVRISRDLHDHIGTQLTIISSEVDNLAYVEQDGKRKEEYEHISDQVRDTMAQLRETIWAMNNDSIKLQMLVAKLQEFGAKALRGRSGFVIDNQLEMEVELGPAQTINIYRICQEALVNAIKHADFNNFQIRIFEKSGNLEFEILDDGKGMDLSEHGNGYGLLNMKERMLQIKGHFEIQSELGRGTQIRLKLKKNTTSVV